MNFKKTALASAVGATLAISSVAPVAYADGHKVQLYGRVNNAIVLNDKDGPLHDESSTNVSTIGSRVGIKASAPINPDLTAIARFEWSASSDDETDSFGDTRIGEVGLMGDFGTVKVGNMWSTFYNVVGTHLDPTVTVGAVLYSTGIDLPYRVSNAIQYSNSFGAISLSAEMRMSDEDHPDEAPGADTEKIGGSDGQAIGISFDISDSMLIAAAVDMNPDDPLHGGEDVDRTGVAFKWSGEALWASVSWGETDISNVGSADQTQFYVGSDFGNGLSGFIGYGMISSSDLDDDPAAVSLNLTKRLGNSGSRVYYEGIMLSDSDGDSYGYEQDWHLFGLRIDF